MKAEDVLKKNGVLLEDFISGSTHSACLSAMEEYHQSQLQALKEEASKVTSEQILEELQFNVIEKEIGSHDLSVHMSYEMLEEFKESVLNLITNLEDQ